MKTLNKKRGVNRHAPLQERFNCSVDKDGPIQPHAKHLGQCWTWIGSRNGCGYGQIDMNKKHHHAHRVSWMLHCGAIPDGMLVLHACDNKGCVRPSHLFLGNHRDNLMDADRKGINPIKRGEKFMTAKLKAVQVLEIRKLRGEGMSASTLARRFNVSTNNIYPICLRQTWKHI